MEPEMMLDGEVWVVGMRTDTPYEDALVMHSVYATAGLAERNRKPGQVVVCWAIHAPKTPGPDQ